MIAAQLALALLGGLVVGSFLNVVAYRLPLGESLVLPGSHCPSCSVPIKPYDNVPVLGWLLLQGSLPLAAGRRSRPATHSSRR